MSLQNGGVSSGGRVAAGARARKHTSVSVDTLDDVCFRSNTAFRCVSVRVENSVILKSLYIKCGKVSVTVGVASSVANDVVMRIGDWERKTRE